MIKEKPESPHPAPGQSVDGSDSRKPAQPGTHNLDSLFTSMWENWYNYLVIVAYDDNGDDGYQKRLLYVMTEKEKKMNEWKFAFIHC